jgi:hypothetical protein
MLEVRSQATIAPHRKVHVPTYNANIIGSNMYSVPPPEVLPWPVLSGLGFCVTDGRIYNYRQSELSKNAGFELRL